MVSRKKLDNDEIKIWQVYTKRANWRQLLWLQEQIDEEVTRRHKRGMKK